MWMILFMFDLLSQRLQVLDQVVFLLGGETGAVFVARVAVAALRDVVLPDPGLRPFVRAAGGSGPVPGRGRRGRLRFVAAGIGPPVRDEAEVLAVEDVVASAEGPRALGGRREQIAQRGHRAVVQVGAAE